MFKKPYLISMLLIAMLVLAACGSTPNENDGNNNGNQNSSTPDTEVDGAENNDIEDNDVDEYANAEEDEGNTEDHEQNVEQDADGQEDSNDETANEETDLKAVDSDAQNYSMSIFPEYTLTSEEPGRDSLYLTEDGSIFMRIETTPLDQETYDFFKENTVDLLTAVNADEEKPAELNELPQGQDIKNAVGYTTNTAEGITSGIVFEKNDLLVRLTIFDTENGDHFNQFVKMGETIVAK